MEKSFIEWALVPVVAVIGWLERTKLSRKEWAAKCETTHTGLCSKIELLHEDIKYVRNRLDEHIDNG